MIPPQQRFHAGDGAPVGIDDGLIVNIEGVRCQRARNFGSIS